MKITDLQEKIMQFVGVWINKNKTPVPRKMIFKHLTDQGVKDYITDKSIASLVKKGYIRKAHLHTRVASYVQLRGLEWR